MKIEFTFGQSGSSAPPDPGTPFNILVLGDFDGRSSRGVIEPLANRQPAALAVDTIESFLERLKAEVQFSQVATAAAPLRIKSAGLDDLHPDHLFSQLDLFAGLRQTRQQLLDPKTAAAAAQEVRSWAAPTDAAPAPTPPTPRPPAPGPAGAETDAQTMERLLGRKPSAAMATRSATADFIRGIVAPYVVSAPAADQAALVAAVDAAVAESMRHVLHDPAFQELEAAWRGLDFLIRNVETSDTLKIQALNVSRAELAADLMTPEDLRQTTLFRLLVENTVQSPGAEPWALLLGLYSFEQSAEDIQLLGRLARLAQAAGAPFIASAAPGFVRGHLQASQAAPTNDVWAALRKEPEAAYIGLTYPHFLLRLPYGQSTDPVSAFAFEEFPAPPEMANYLWGQTPLALGVLLGQQFAASGWGMDPDAGLELAGLPVHLFKQDGESQMTPCAELWLTDTQAERLLAEGLMPFQSVRGKDAIRLLRVQSLRYPPAPLAGRWQPRLEN